MHFVTLLLAVQQLILTCYYGLYELTFRNKCNMSNQLLLHVHAQPKLILIIIYIVHAAVATNDCASLHFGNIYID